MFMFYLSSRFSFQSSDSVYCRVCTSRWMPTQTIFISDMILMDNRLRAVHPTKTVQMNINNLLDQKKKHINNLEL